MAEQSIKVRHNVEMGHRLSQQPDSKCFHLHGHSWWIDLELFGPVNPSGMVCDLNFGDVKKRWRGMLDEHFDHHLCLNVDDPLVLFVQEAQKYGLLPEDVLTSWGITTVPFDPTVENMARHWGLAARGMFTQVSEVRINVQEAATNAATWQSSR